MGRNRNRNQQSAPSAPAVPANPVQEEVVDNNEQEAPEPEVPAVEAPPEPVAEAEVVEAVVEAPPAEPEPEPEPEPVTEHTSRRYRIRAGAPDHWDGSQLIKAGGVIVLPVGTRPGRWLDPIA